MGKIQVVDDDVGQVLEPLVRQLGRVFGREQVEGIACAAAALKLAERDTFDVVLTDLMMPGIDGYESCRLFRADPLNFISSF
ncbi:MAG: response regulator [Magnetococcales bacterium]|nr:response regulator [Magnetococcales bacterium]